MRPRSCGSGDTSFLFSAYVTTVEVSVAVVVVDDTVRADPVWVAHGMPFSFTMTTISFSMYTTSTTMGSATRDVVGVGVEVEVVEVDVEVVVTEARTGSVVFAASAFPKKLPPPRPNPTEMVGKGMEILGSNCVGVDKAGGRA